MNPWKPTLLALCFGMEHLALADSFRIYELSVNQEKLEQLGLTWETDDLPEDLHGSFMAGGDKGRLLLNHLGDPAIVIRAYAEASQEESGDWVVEQTYPLTYQKTTDDGRPPEETTIKIGLSLHITGSNGDVAYKYTRREIEQWEEVGETLQPIFSTRAVDGSAYIESAVAIGGITIDGKNTVIIIERLPDPA